ncbi:MAG: hypothetical protein M1318_00735 [Firmicutes bacterium]|nr:hypothetical protein [Bacillota bacterium]
MAVRKIVTSLFDSGLCQSDTEFQQNKAQSLMTVRKIVTSSSMAALSGMFAGK